jgi:hypothetical protein
VASGGRLETSIAARPGFSLAGAGDRSRGAAWGIWGEKAAQVPVAGGEAGQLWVRPVKNKEDFKIQLRIFQTTQNRK